MTRAKEAFTNGGIAVVIYIILFLGLIPLPEIIQDKIIPVVRVLIFHLVFLLSLLIRVPSSLGGHLLPLAHTVWPTWAGTS